MRRASSSCRITSYNVCYTKLLRSFKKYFPDAKLKQTNWGNDFEDTYILDADDPLFAEIGKKFLEVQQEIYGTDHLYSADTFNENEPPSDDPQYLSELSAIV